MKNFKTYSLAVEFYRETRTLPLPAALKEQLSRAAPSIALNLAEGYGKGSAKDRNRFFQISFGSVRECQAILDLAEYQNSAAARTLDKLAAHLYNLIRYRA